MRTNRVIYALVFLALGFLIAFSYQMASKEPKEVTMTDRDWNRNIELRDQLIDLEQKNRSLQKELNENQEKLWEIEKNIAGEEDRLSSLANEAEQLRMLLGKVKVRGEGIVVTLADGQFDASLSENVNNFIVHEHHVFKVVNELYISGAEAVAINGKRLTSHSYIVCNGPVITVDGEQFPAPFVISAIGDNDTLEKALNIQGGVKDQLISDNIVFKIEKKDLIEMDPIYTMTK